MRMKPQPAGRAWRAAFIAVSSLLIALTLDPLPGRGDPTASASDLNAVVNGQALASGVLIPFGVQPDLSFWPGYTLSRTDHSSAVSESKGRSGGIYPGFIVNATFFLYGQQGGFPGTGNALFGISESSWPDPPSQASGSTADVEAYCNIAQTGSAFAQLRDALSHIPVNLLDECKKAWPQYGGMLPFSVLASRSQSGPLTANGSADVLHLTLSDLMTIGSSHTTSDTRVVDGTTVSTATAVLKDVQIGPLHIDEVDSRAEAADGAKPGFSRSLQIFGATVAGFQVNINDEGVSPVSHNPVVETVLQQFQNEGLDIRLVSGDDLSLPETDSFDGSQGGSSVKSGGLMIRLTHSGPAQVAGEPIDIVGAGNRICDKGSQLQGKSRLLDPGSVYNVNYDLGKQAPAAASLYKQLWDLNFPLQLLLPDTIEGTQPIPPVFPCLTSYFNRAVDLGVVLGVTAADARYLPGSPSGGLGFTIPAIPDQTLVQTITIPGTQGFSGQPVTQTLPTANNAARPGDESGLASKLKALYALLMLTFIVLVAGRIGFRNYTRT